MRMRRIFPWLVVIALAACNAPAAAPTQTPTPAALRHIRLPMGFIPSVQFAPFYVAVDKGYFAAEGIELEFDYSYETDGVGLVGANKLPFAIVSGEQVLLARAQGLPVVYVMAWFQKFPVAVIAKADSGITQPADLKGKKIGTPLLNGANFVGLRALLAKAGVKAEDVTVEAIGFNQVPALTAGQVDAVVVYTNNEPIRLAAQGEKLNTIPVGDFVSLAANGLLTNEDTLAKDPELVRAFVRALTHGIQDTMANPDEAYAVSKKFVAELKDDAVEKQVLAATIDMWKTDRIGYSNPMAWETMQATLRDAGLLTTQVDLSKAYTNEFVP
jgi:putative riboflavin transport system substrate-binding protein